MTKLPIILDDLIEEELQNQIEDAMFDCLWDYKSDNVFGSNDLEMKYRKFLSPLDFDISPAFMSNMQSPPNKKVYNKVVIPIIQKGCDKINFNIEKIQRCCGAIHALITDKSKNTNNNIHINVNVPHLVMIYYVNDCDGDTILYDKTLDDIPWGPNNFTNDFGQNRLIDHKFNIQHKITPKRGRILFFDGRIYHSPSTPTTGMRCIITLDLFGEFEDGSYKFPASQIEPIPIKKFIEYK
jgi:hypothetical protein